MPAGLRVATLLIFLSLGSALNIAAKRLIIWYADRNPNPVLLGGIGEIVAI